MGLGNAVDGEEYLLYAFRTRFACRTENRIGVMINITDAGRRLNRSNIEMTTWPRAWSIADLGP